MGRITAVTIRGFQSHVDSFFSLAPGLTVITGPSDAGKTAVIRALRWLAFNEPTGDAFLHTIRNADGTILSQADQAEVVIEFSDGSVISKVRRKGKTTYTHSAYADPWEKAEVPPEIKGALGLDKQSYGDTYDTCLNFAYQLDPPFLLSEAGSVGAKVLGKLAGTEVVDRAIGAVTKLVHRTREQRNQAEKTVGQLDVELLEYLGVDEQLAQLAQCEVRFSALEDTAAKIATLDNLGKTFWANIQKCRDTKARLRVLAPVDALRDRFDTVTATATTAESLVQLQTRYSAASVNRETYAQRLGYLAVVDNIAPKLQGVGQTFAKHSTVAQLGQRYQQLVGMQEQLTRSIADAPDTDALQGLIDRVVAVEERRQQLIAINQAATRARAAVRGMNDTLAQCEKEVLVAAQQLTDTWAAAGGVCPMCGQPVEGGFHCEQ